MVRILSVILAVTVHGALARDCAVESKGDVMHRRMVRDEIEKGGADVAEAFLRDADASVRRYALYSLFAADSAKGRIAARAMAGDPDDSVKSLVQELVRERREHRRISAALPPSQDPANDHDLIRLLSVSAEGETFALPPKPVGCDAVEIWFGEQKQRLMVWVNDILVGEYDPKTDGGREFRVEATKAVRWGMENKVWATDDRGKDKWLRFSVEVFKCGN